MKMVQEKNIIIMEKYVKKENIYLDKDMEKEKNMIKMVY